VVLVTGATSGFGEKTASMLGQKGYKVFGTSRRPASSDKPVIKMLQLEIGSDQSVASCVAAIIELAGHLDVLVNNAGQAHTGGLEETTGRRGYRLPEYEFVWRNQDGQLSAARDEEAQ
jgi:NADP-dependent 3-hydroxy acid dehydrogenase YdfG